MSHRAPVEQSAVDSSGAIQVAGDHNLVVYLQQTIARGEADPTPWLLAYLRLMYSQWQDLPLGRIVVEAGTIGVDDIKLPALYTPLDVWASRSESDRKGRAHADQVVLEPDSDRQQPREPALAALMRQPHCVLTGDPGSGKSTVVRFLVVCMAGALLGEPVNMALLRRSASVEGKAADDEGDRGSVQDGGGDGEADDDVAVALSKAPLPIYMELRKFAASPAFPATEPGRASDWLKYLSESLADLGIADGEMGRAITDALTRTDGGAIWIVLDGIDEVAEAEGRRVRLKQVIESVADTFPRARILVTARTYAYQAGQKWRLSSRFAESRLAPYSDDQIERYVERWYASLAAQRPAELGGGVAATRAADLVAQVAAQRSLHDLAERPLLLTMIALLHNARGGLPPGGLATLYDETVALLVHRWNRVRDEPPLTDGLGLSLAQLREALERVAFDVHRDQSQAAARNAADIPVDVLIGAFDAVRRAHMDAATEVTGERFDSLDCRRRLHYRAGILVSDDEEVYRFPHRSFQEYLAACALQQYPYALKLPVDAGPPSDPEEGWGFPENLARLVAHDPDRWREVTRMAAGLAAKSGADTAWALVDSLCENVVPTERDSPLWWGGLLAARALVDHNLRASRPSNRHTHDRVRLWLRRMLELGALPPPDRAEAGRVLAGLVDDRPGVGLRADGLPDLDWCEVPAGAFAMGSKRFDDEMPVRKEMMAAFSIARYPVTHAQFQAFVEDPDGYANDRWWQGLARLEADPADASWPIANHPRERVSWYEAVAFCRWLTARLSGSGAIPSGMEIRLPTEQEWEKAARGTDGREWPWGPEWDGTMANTHEGGLRRTAPVGMYPDGASPYGVLDMAGNVWEWCLNEYGKPANVGTTGDRPRVLRGGSWVGNQVAARAASRYDAPPRLRNYDVGFRCVLGSPISG